MAKIEMRSCPTHGDVDHRWSRSKNNKNGKFYERWECTQCANNYSRDRLRADKIKAIGYLGGACMDCGQTFPDHPAVFDFHHRDPNTKLKKPSAFLGHKWEKLRNELDKCDLLCSNCHRIRHAEE